jgi:hypothetical protein
MNKSSTKTLLPKNAKLAIKPAVKTASKKLVATTKATTPAVPAYPALGAEDESMDFILEHMESELEDDEMSEEIAEMSYDEEEVEAGVHPRKENPRSIIYSQITEEMILRATRECEQSRTGLVFLDLPDLSHDQEQSDVTATNTDYDGSSDISKLLIAGLDMDDLETVASSIKDIKLRELLLHVAKAVYNRHERQQIPKKDFVTRALGYLTNEKEQPDHQVSNYIMLCLCKLVQREMLDATTSEKVLEMALALLGKNVPSWNSTSIELVHDPLYDDKISYYCAFLLEKCSRVPQNFQYFVSVNKRTNEMVFWRIFLLYGDAVKSKPMEEEEETLNRACMRQEVAEMLLSSLLTITADKNSYNCIKNEYSKQAKVGNSILGSIVSLFNAKAKKPSNTVTYEQVPYVLHDALKYHEDYSKVILLTERLHNICFKMPHFNMVVKAMIEQIPYHGAEFAQQVGYTIHAMQEICERERKSQPTSIISCIITEGYFTALKEKLDANQTNPNEFNKLTFTILFLSLRYEHLRNEVKKVFFKEAPTSLKTSFTQAMNNQSQGEVFLQKWQQIALA